MVSNGPALDKTPTPEELATALDSSTALCRELHDKTVSLGRVVADLQSTVATLTGERDTAISTARTATAEAATLRASVPKLAAAKAAEILGSFGVPPDTGARPSKTMPASAGAGSVAEQFKAMRPGSPEANAFFAEHRKALLG